LRYRAAAPFKIRSNVRGEARKCRGRQTLGLPICSLPILQRRQTGEPQYDGGSEHLESKRGRRSAAESHDERDGNRGEEVVTPAVTEEVSGHAKLSRSINYAPVAQRIEHPPPKLFMGVPASSLQ
jgi:hypothetical protein